MRISLCKVRGSRVMIAGAFVAQCAVDQHKIGWIARRTNLAGGSNADQHATATYEQWFQVGQSVNLSQPRLAPSRRLIPERIGTTTILLFGRNDSYHAGDSCCSQTKGHGSFPITQPQNKVVTKPVYLKVPRLAREVAQCPLWVESGHNPGRT